MDNTLNDEERRIVDTVRSFVREHVAPHAATWERERRVPVETFREAAAHGITGLFAPPERGGAGVGLAAAMRVFEELGAGCMAFGFSLEVQNNLVAGLLRNGSEAQIARHLPALLSGETIGAFLLTEPGAGSDAAAIATTATRVGDGWVLDGEKAWVTNGAVAGLLLVFAQTDRAARARGIAGFLVDATTPRVERQAPESLLGGHAMGTAGFVFRGARLDAGALFLEPGAGFRAAMQGIDIARAGVAAMCVGMLRAGLDCALDYAAARRAFGRPTIEFQALQWMLADVATDIEAARLLTGHAATAIAAGGGRIEAAHAKKFASRAALKGLADCMQAMGAAGFRAEYPLGRHLACAKMAQYLDGTTEIQNLVIARGLMKERDGTQG